MKLGDAISKVVTPAARAIGLDCVDETTGDLKPDSPCAQRREILNDFGDRIYDELFQPKRKDK